MAMPITAASAGSRPLGPSPSDPWNDDLLISRRSRACACCAAAKRKCDEVRPCRRCVATYGSEEAAMEHCVPLPDRRTKPFVDARNRAATEARGVEMLAVVATTVGKKGRPRPAPDAGDGDDAVGHAAAKRRGIDRSDSAAVPAASGAAPAVSRAHAAVPAVSPHLDSTGSAIVDMEEFVRIGIMRSSVPMLRLLFVPQSARVAAAYGNRAWHAMFEITPTSLAAMAATGDIPRYVYAEDVAVYSAASVDTLARRSETQEITCRFVAATGRVFLARESSSLEYSGAGLVRAITMTYHAVGQPAPAAATAGGGISSFVARSRMGGITIAPAKATTPAMSAAAARPAVPGRNVMADHILATAQASSLSQVPSGLLELFPPTELPDFGELLPCPISLAGLEDDRNSVDGELSPAAAAAQTGGDAYEETFLFKPFGDDGEGASAGAGVDCGKPGSGSASSRCGSPWSDSGDSLLSATAAAAALGQAPPASTCCSSHEHGKTSAPCWTADGACSSADSRPPSPLVSSKRWNEPSKLPPAPNVSALVLEPPSAVLDALWSTGPAGMQAAVAGGSVLGDCEEGVHMGMDASWGAARRSGPGRVGGGGDVASLFGGMIAPLPATMFGGDGWFD